MKQLLILPIAATILGSSATAAIIATGSSNTSQGFYNTTISTTDLLAGTSPTVTGAFAGDTNGIYDGVTVDSSLTTTGGNIYLSSNPDVIMTFDLTGSVTGYDITSIASVAGWNTNAQHHAAQFYQVLVSVVGSAAYTSLNITGAAASGGNASYDPFGSGQGSSRIVLTENSSGVLASGVDSIRFVLISTPDGLDNDTVYKEIDVFGTATVIPEPSSALLCGLGVLALLRRRRL